MTSSKRVLLMYISEVSGHHQATLAIEKSLKALDASVQVRNINGFGYAYPIVEKIVNKAYMGIIKRTPQIWDYLYDNPKIVKRTQSIKEAIHKANHSKLKKLFDEFKPQVVACSQAFPCGLVADYKKTYNLDITVIGVLTDYAPHSYWINEGIDYYIVPSKEAGERFIKKGVQESQVKVFGLPADPKFSAPLNTDIMAAKLGLDLSLPVILVMGGGQGLGPIKDIIRSLEKVGLPIQIMVVAGINKKLIKWLKKFSSKADQKIFIFEYVRNIEELMSVATLIVTKPGGMTTTEALTKGLPMVIVKPLPGQEMHNTQFLTEKEVAIRVSNFKIIGKEVEALLKAPERLSLMRKAAFENSYPKSSMDIAELILSHCA